LNAGLDVISALLEQSPKLLYRETRVADDTAKSERIDRVVAGNSQYACAVRHYDVLALSDDSEARLFQGPDRIKMIDAGDLGQG
jgi:hypothetical protein